MGKPPLFSLRAIVPTLALCLLIAPAGFAQSLYSAEVDYDAAVPQARSKAYEAALLKVLARVTSAELSADGERIRGLFPNPSAYVLRFAAGEDETLLVTFDGRAIENTLRRAGELVWGEQRPPTLIWIAVDWGDGERELIAAADDAPPVADELDVRAVRRDFLRQRIFEAAERRGLPVLFPLLDIDDLSAVSFADVWGGFDQPVLEASARYDVESVLIGRIREDGASFGRWTHYLGDSAVSFGGEVEIVVDRLADVLAAEFSIGGNAPLREVTLSVSGVTDVEAYAAVQKLIADVVVVERATLAGVAGDQLDYRLSVYGGADRLSRALKLAGLIEEEPEAIRAFDTDGGLAESTAVDDNHLAFYYSP